MKKLTNEEFKKRLINKFNYRYDLSKVNYVNAFTKVCLICREHGEFWALPGNLLAGKGCPKCGHAIAASKMRKDINDILLECIAVHGDKYDYSLFTEYKNRSTKIPIICHEKDENGVEHGIFYQDYAHHVLRGHGCPKCAGNKKLTEEEIIAKAKKVWGNTYLYDKSHPLSTHSKMTITCPIHGDFEMTPHDHIDGKQGCPKCRYKRLWDTRGRLTVEEVKEKFRQVHGDKYDYSEFTEYKNNRTKIKVICPEHGEFMITPNSHLNGHGCPACSLKKMKEYSRLELEEVKRRIREVHGDKYIIPDDFEYINNRTKVKLICPEHGEFYQCPFNLWKGVGCPKCNKSKLEEEISLFLERNDFDFEEQKKFDWLKNYELDFYIEKYNVAIECQGIQHFKPVEMFGGEEQFIKQKQWDTEKKQLCEENGVKLLYFTNKKLKKRFCENDGEITCSKKTLLEEIKS